MNENEWKVVWPLGTIWPLAPHIAREWSVVLPVSRICGAISNGQSESPSHTRKKIKSLDYYRSRYLYYSNYMAM